MENLLKIILGTLLGTSTMTAFSYAVSAQFHKTFQEPRLLRYIMKLCVFKLSARSKMIAAWYIHYGIGLMFVFSYDYLWNRGAEFSWRTAILFGAISGIVGIIGWIIIFNVPSKKPKVAFNSYFLQLFLAHILFAVVVVAAYKGVSFLA